MHRADKAVLRLGVGLGLAVLIAYGLALPACLRGLRGGCVVAVQTRAADPVREGRGVRRCHRCIAGGGRADGPAPGKLPRHRTPPDRRIALRSVFRRRAQRQSVDDLSGDRPHDSFLWPVSPSRRWPRHSLRPSGWGWPSAFWSAVSHTPCSRILPAPPPSRRRALQSAPEAAGWSALQATLVVMPVFVVALTNPALYHPGHHENGHGGPAGRRHQRAYGRSRVRGIDIRRRTDGGGGLGRPHAAAEPLDADVMDRGRSALGGRPGCSGSSPRRNPHRSGSMR